jgi:hypothetical protein
MADKQIAKMIENGKTEKSLWQRTSLSRSSTVRRIQTNTTEEENITVVATPEQMQPP